MPTQGFKTVTLRASTLERVEKLVRPSKYESVADFIDQAIRDKLREEEEEVD
jgi:Arc/MetJ-type ribon-helix-helix transcriptional regulator